MDERPPVWVGHVVVGATDLQRSVDFYATIGMRPVERSDEVAIFELRGGTHLVVVPADAPPDPATDAPFDLMVEDLDAVHAAWSQAGLDPGPIKSNEIHSRFKVRDPDGWVISVFNSHVIGPV